MSHRDPGSVVRTPGTAGPRSTPPSARYDAAGEIRRARTRADLSDFLDLSILLAVNLMFKIWATAHIPFLSRDASMAILLTANALYVVDWLVTRFVPQWRARRIASTWSQEERARARF